MDPSLALSQIINEQRESRLKSVRNRTESEAAQQSFHGTIAGYDGAVGLWFVRIRGGSHLHGRSLSNAAFEIGESVSAFLDRTGLLWVDKLSSG
jgi:hypothetical protein